ncbi:3-oxo-tetronate kinase [Curvivirga sp.]|uniref:3-oxo-tetronate kinase n=1 Tax=Curvivirga sp. TaxID=2856848 RepID=UPI003B5AB3EE
MSVILGCIADDLTGATDIAMILQRSGLKVAQIVGVPYDQTPVPDADAIVISLKSRTIPAADAIDQSITSCRWLKDQGAQQIFFKYCSTFDSTEQGNIGPVCDALMQELNVKTTIACPSFPENGRTVYKGHLFVNDVLLSASPLKDHPLTPMTNSNLKQVLSSQCDATVENIFFNEIENGIRPLSDTSSSNPNSKIYIMDSLTDEHLLKIGKACKDLSLITGGSAVGQGLIDNYLEKGILSSKSQESFDAPIGKTVILSGSCSEATRKQIAYAKLTIDSFQINVFDILSGKDVVTEALSWAENQLQDDDAVLIYSSTTPDDLEHIHKHGNALEIGEQVEAVLSTLATKLHAQNIKRFVVAGGETSGAVINSLNVNTLEIGPMIDPGVPWTKSIGDSSIALALKSGNFGSDDFFTKAISQLNSLNGR